MNSINLSEKAIAQALKSQWSDAIETNKEILLTEPEDIDALNRLARAYYELGDISNAKKTSNKVLKIDSTNKIAEKALDKYNISKDGVTKDSDHNSINLSDFIEEAGTTRQTSLLNLCSEKIISSLNSGDELELVSHSHKVSVTTADKKYVGKLPDDISAKVRTLARNGYKYKVIVKSADKQCIKVIIKEVKRGKGLNTKPSFPRESSESLSE